jgi:predicted dehydrogenase
MPDKLRIGFIGAGGNTRARHIPGLKSQPDVELAWVCNRSMESGQKVAAEFGIEKVTTNPEDVFNDASIDAICIGTWPYKHKDLTVWALQSGKHVLCEARMAMNAAEAREMLAATRAHPNLVAQVVPALFEPRCGATIRKMMDDGYVGRPTEIVITVLSGQGLAPDRPLQWRHRFDQSGTNTMFVGAYNEIIQRWAGDTTRVVADAKVFVGKRVDPDTGRDVEVVIPDSVTVAAKMSNGARASYVMSYVAPVAQRTSITIYGTEGAIAWDQGDRMSAGKRGGQLEPIEPDPALVGSWRVEQDFVESIRDGKPVRLVSFEDGVRYMEFTDAVWRSWTEGRAVDVPPV